jgi:cysteine sulfinate desulfinase/cysteine desulfurase-like protein
MDVPYSKAMGSIRFSFGRFNTESEVAKVIDEIEKAVENLSSFSV